MAPVGMASKESTQKLEKAMLSASIVCEVSFLDLDRLYARIGFLLHLLRLLRFY